MFTVQNMGRQRKNFKVRYKERERVIVIVMLKDRECSLFVCMNWAPDGS